MFYSYDIDIDFVKQQTQSWLSPSNEPILQPGSWWKKQPAEIVSIWCVLNGLYCIPTVELVSWLKEQIKEYNISEVLEIGSGSTGLGRHLGCRRTDLYMHLKKEVRVLYELTKQPITVPSQDVEKIEALEAVNKYKPKVVIGSWITQLGNPSVPQSSPFGVNETDLLSKVEKYIIIGHEDSHGKKLIMKIPHETYRFPWLISRSGNPGKEIIYVWNNKTSKEKK